MMGTNENMTKVTLLTSSYRINGYIDLLPGARVTDYMQEAKEFVAVKDAEVYQAEVAGPAGSGGAIPQREPQSHRDHHPGLNAGACPVHATFLDRAGSAQRL